MSSVEESFVSKVRQSRSIAILLEKTSRMQIQVGEFRQDNFLETIFGRGLYPDLNPQLPSDSTAINARRAILLVALRAIQEGDGAASFFNFSEALTNQSVKRTLQEASYGPKKRTKLEKRLRKIYTYRFIVSIGEVDIAQALAMIPYKNH
jgi:hypothetical protein